MVGAGTMGAGIAQLACAAGMETRLHDPVPEALDRGVERLRKGLAKLAEKGRLSAAEADAAAERCVPAPTLADLADCELVIEAAPERPELKRELFAALSEICGPDDRAGHEHLVDPGHLARGRRGAARARGGHALLQPAAADEAAGGDPGGADRRARAWRSRAPPARRWAST